MVVVVVVAAVSNQNILIRGERLFLLRHHNQLSVRVHHDLAGVLRGRRCRMGRAHRNAVLHDALLSVGVGYQEGLGLLGRLGSLLVLVVVVVDLNGVSCLGGRWLHIQRHLVRVQ